MARGAERAIDLESLRALIVLVETGSVTQAADRLGLTQSGMSHALRRLRERFDDPLLVRGGKGMKPTPRAEELARRATRILEDVDALASETPSFDPKTAQRRFTIAADDNQSTQLVPPLLAKLGRIAPGVDLQVVPIPRQVRDALEQGEVDLVLGLMEPEQAGLFTQALYTDRFAVAVRKSHPDLTRRVTLEKYLEAGHIIVGARLPFKSFVDEILAQQGLQRRIALRIPTFLAALRVVSETDLVITTSESLIKTLTSTLPLHRFAPPLELPTISVQQTWHERVHRDPAHVWLRGVLVKLTSRQRGSST